MSFFRCSEIWRRVRARSEKRSERMWSWFMRVVMGSVVSYYFDSSSYFPSFFLLSTISKIVSRTSSVIFNEINSNS